MTLELQKKALMEEDMTGPGSSFRPLIVLGKKLYSNVSFVFRFSIICWDEIECRA